MTNNEQELGLISISKGEAPKLEPWLLLNKVEKIADETSLAILVPKRFPVFHTGTGG